MPATASYRRPLRIRAILICFAILVQFLLSRTACAAEKSVRVQLALDKSRIASDSFLITRIVSIEDLTIQSARLSDYSGRIKLNVGNQSTLVAVTAGSLQKGSLVAGLVKVNSKTRKLPALKLKKRKTRTAAANAPAVAAMLPSRAVLANAADTGMATVALRDSAFSVSGPGTAPWMALAGRDTAATAMASVECYRQEDGFIITETSQEFFNARERELALCRNGNSSACFDPQSYIPPNASVTGSFTSDGANFTIALTFIDEHGTESAATLAQGPRDSFMDLLILAGKDLGEKICESRALKVTIAPTGFNQGNCAFTDAGGCGCTELTQGFYWEGGHYIGDMRGPIDSTLEISASEGETSRGRISCGDWTKIACEEKLCCKRELGQPALAHFDAELNFPLNVRHCECRSEIPTLILSAKVAKGSRTKSETLAVNCPI